MDSSTITIIALCVVVLLILAFFAVFRHKGKFKIKSIFGEVSAEGENAPPVDSATKSEVKPLKITALPPQMIRIDGGFMRWGVFVEIYNENQSVSDVRLKIKKAEPDFRIQHGASLDAIEFSLIGFSNRILHRNQKCRVLLFTTEFTGLVNLTFQSSDKEKNLLVTPQIENGKPIKHVLTLETSATGVDTHEQKFKILCQNQNKESPARLEEIKGIDDSLAGVKELI